MNAIDHKAAIDHEIDRLFQTVDLTLEQILSLLEEVKGEIEVRVEAIKEQLARDPDEEDEEEEEDEDDDWDDDDEEEDDGDPYGIEYDR